MTSAPVSDPLADHLITPENAAFLDGYIGLIPTRTTPWRSLTTSAPCKPFALHPNEPRRARDFIQQSPGIVSPHGSHFQPVSGPRDANTSSSQPVAPNGSLSNLKQRRDKSKRCCVTAYVADEQGR